MDEKSPIHLHLISDSTGDTLLSILHAVISDYEEVFEEHLYPVVCDQEKLAGVMASIEQRGGIVFTTLVDEKLQKTLEEFCRKQGNLPVIPILEPLIKFFNKYLGRKPKRKIGGKYTLDDSYFQRMEALAFTMAHDDGNRLETVHQADIILLGISRTSKTPTSIYLAHRGYKVANIPFVYALKQDFKAINYGKAFLTGLVAAPARIMQVRENRLSQLNAGIDSDYADLRKIIEEIRHSKNLFENMKMPYVDVTRRSVEETAAHIISLMAEKQGYGL